MPVLSHLKIGQKWPQEVGSNPKFSFWRFLSASVFLQFFIRLLKFFSTSSFNSLSTICIYLYMVLVKSLWSAHAFFGRAFWEVFWALRGRFRSRKVEKVSLWSSVWTQTRNTKGKGGGAARESLALGGCTSLVLTRTANDRVWDSGGKEGNRESMVDARVEGHQDEDFDEDLMKIFWWEEDFDGKYR